MDEAQIAAEHDLRKAHDTESQNVATALKHMMAYCAGGAAVDPTMMHDVKEEDHKKLARQLILQQNLYAKHESAINVLRAKQERDTKAKKRWHIVEVQQLAITLDKDKQAQESQFIKDLSRLEALFEMKKRRSRNRWELRWKLHEKQWSATSKDNSHQEMSLVASCLNDSSAQQWPIGSGEVLRTVTHAKDDRGQEWHTLHKTPRSSVSCTRDAQVVSPC